jgi:hypothetical protein
MVPAIPLRPALSPDHRDARVKPAHDAREGKRSQNFKALPIQARRALSASRKSVLSGLGLFSPKAGLAALTATRQILMHERNGHAAFTDSRRDPLDRAEANIAAGENSGSARLKQIRIPVR